MSDVDREIDRLERKVRALDIVKRELVAVVDQQRPRKAEEINVNLNESEDDAIEKHLQEWKRLKDEYTKSKAQAGAETVSSGSDKQMAETTTADSGGEVHVTSGAEVSPFEGTPEHAAETMLLRDMPDHIYDTKMSGVFRQEVARRLADCVAVYARHIAARSAPPPQAGAEDAEYKTEVIAGFDGPVVRLTIGVQSFNFPLPGSHEPEMSDKDYAEWYKERIDSAMRKYARHIAAKAVEDRVCRGSCGCPDCHVLADKAGYVPVPDTAGLVETENLLGEIGDHIDDFIDNKTSRNETANFIVETAKRYLWKL